jgi:Beta-1,3-glucanase
MVLASLALASMLSACAGGTRSLPTVMNGQSSSVRTFGPSASTTSTTLTFVNKSVQASNKIWFCYYGLNPVGGAPVYLANATGTLKKTTPGMGPTNLCVNVAASKSFVFPELNAARLYVSYDKPLTFTTGGDSRPVPPNPARKTDPTYATKWDFFEITYLPEAGAKNGRWDGNLSVLQSANLNMQFTLKGVIPGTTTPVSYTRGWLVGGFAAFVKQMQANPTYAKLVLPNTQRVLNPGTAIQAFLQKLIPSPIFPTANYANYVNRSWTKYQTATLTFVGDPPPNSQTKLNWTGKVVNGQFVFTPGKNSLGLTNVVWKKPATVDIFENNYKFCVSGCPKTGQQLNYANQIFGTLMAVYNRSMMLVNTTFTNGPQGQWCKTRNLWYSDPTTNNLFVEDVHANSLQKFAYAFQSDDHCDVSSFVSVWNPSAFTITFTK